jgi:stage II sporulation protein D
MMRHLILLISFSLLSTLTFGQEKVRIGILTNKNLQEIQFKIIGNGAFVNDQNRTWIQSENSIITIKNIGGLIRFQCDSTSATASKITLQASNEGYFQVQLTPQSRKLKYGENIEIKIVNNQLQMVNVMTIDTYISGVVEAEGGPNHELEYYKAQAVISRTYALSQFYKHIDDGYNLCDQTHCQAFNGLPKHEHIMVNAAEQTKSLVIVDENANLITAAFHSNCGGRTNNAEHVWSRPLSYCVAKEDTFCIKMPNSNWEKRIPIQDWKRYLESKKIQVSDTAQMGYFPAEKELYYREGGSKVLLVDMRKELKLKSTYFSAHQDGNDMVLIGQGFGHGVGLCQEGAIRMGQLGYSFEDIIHFYYSNVKIIPYQYIAFFKLD